MVTPLKWTPTLIWMVYGKDWSQEQHQKYICYAKIELCAQYICINHQWVWQLLLTQPKEKDNLLFDTLSLLHLKSKFEIWNDNLCCDSQLLTGWDTSWFNPTSKFFCRGGNATIEPHTRTWSFLRSCKALLMSLLICFLELFILSLDLG